MTRCFAALALLALAACGQPEDRCAGARHWYLTMVSRDSCAHHGDCAVAPTAHWQADGQMGAPAQSCPTAVRGTEAMGVQLAVDNLEELHCAVTTPALPTTCRGRTGHAECVEGHCELVYSF